MARAPPLVATVAAPASCSHAVEVAKGGGQCRHCCLGDGVWTRDRLPHHVHNPLARGSSEQWMAYLSVGPEDPGSNIWAKRWRTASCVRTGKTGSASCSWPGGAPSGIDSDPPSDATDELMRSKKPRFLAAPTDLRAAAGLPGSPHWIWKPTRSRQNLSRPLRPMVAPRHGSS